LKDYLEGKITLVAPKLWSVEVANAIRSAVHAKKIIGVEIDPRFTPFLANIQSKHSNVQIIYQNVLILNLKKLMLAAEPNAPWQIVSNLPFNITEPFLKALTDLPITDAILILGQSMTERLMADGPLNDLLTKTAVMAQTFFDISVTRTIPKSHFYPESATNTSVVVLTPKPAEEFQTNPKLAILRKLFLSEGRHVPIAQVINSIDLPSEDGPIRDKAARNRHSRREARRALKNTATWGSFINLVDNPLDMSAGRSPRTFSLPKSITDQPFANLNNHELRSLIAAIDKN